MKKLACLLSLAITAGSAYADLGDTYAESVRNWGRPSGTKGTIIWWLSSNPNRTSVGETFYHNQCVAIYFMPLKGRYLYESEIWRLLQRNSRPGTIWNKYGGDSESIWYATRDGSLYAALSTDGALRIAYKSYLERHGLLNQRTPDDDQPPVEDTPVNYTEDQEAKIGALGGALVGADYSKIVPDYIGPDYIAPKRWLEWSKKYFV